MLLQIAEALSAALAANVVHMDVKTNNIMIDDAVSFAAEPVPEWCVVAVADLGRVTVICEVDLGAAGYHVVRNCVDVPRTLSPCVVCARAGKPSAWSREQWSLTLAVPKSWARMRASL